MSQEALMIVRGFFQVDSFLLGLFGDKGCNTYVSARTGFEKSLIVQAIPIIADELIEQ